MATTSQTLLLAISKIFPHPLVNCKRPTISFFLFHKLMFFVCLFVCLFVSCFQEDEFLWNRDHSKGNI